MVFFNWLDLKWVAESCYSAASRSKTLIVPDKDADGLDAGVIIHKTLSALGMSTDLISVHLISKNGTVHDEMERAAMLAKNPKYIIIADQGSRAAPPVVDSLDTKSLIIDHHLSDEFPKNATVRHFLFKDCSNQLKCSGCFGLSFSSCCNVCSSDLRDMQASASIYCFCFWLSMRYGYAWRSRQHSQMEASVPRYEGGLQGPYEESDQ